MIVELTDEQVRVINAAAHMYAMIAKGRYEVIIEHVLDPRMSTDDYCRIRDSMLEYCGRMNALYVPHDDESMHDSNVAFNIHQVFRHEMGDNRIPEDYWQVGMPKIIGKAQP